MNSFKTVNDIEYFMNNYKKSRIIAYIIILSISTLGLLISFVAFTVFLAIAIAVCIMMHTMPTTTQAADQCEFQFKNDFLTIINYSSNKIYEVSNIPASDFIIKQSKKDKKLDYCNFSIKNTIFIYGGVKNCTELKKYIEENYPKEL